jgi:hypothetical protein
VQGGEPVRLIGVDRRPALDERAFAAQRGIGAGTVEDALDEAAGLVVAFAERQRPRCCQEQARPPVDLFGGQALQPLEHRALAASGHQRFVQAALGEVVGVFATTGRERMEGRRFEHPLLGQRVGCAPVQRRLLVRRQQREAATQLVARERMHAQPLVRLAGGEHRRVARQSRQSLAGVADPGHGGAQLGLQQVEDRDPGQERDVGRLEIGQQQVDESVVQDAGLRRGHGDLRLRIAAGRHDREGELQAERPPSVSSCRRADASRSTRVPKRPRTSSRVSSSRNARSTAPMRVAVP